MIDPPSGTNTVSINLSVDANWHETIGVATSFYNVNQSSPLRTFASNYSSPSSTASVSLNVPSASGELVFSAVSHRNNTTALTVGAGQTQRFNTQGWGAYDLWAAGSTASGASSVTMTWTHPETVYWAIGGVSIRPGPGVSSTLTDNAEYLAIANGLIANFSSAKDWLVYPYGSITLGAPKVYQELYTKFATSNICQVVQGSGAIPNVQGIFRIGNPNFSTSGALDVAGRTPAGCTAQTGKDATVVFVDGDLNITDNLPYTRATVFIVGGNVTISAGVQTINAILLADRSVSTGTNSSGPDASLTVNGGVMGVLGGAGQLSLQRDLGAANSTTPSESFIFDPRYFFLLSDYLGDSRAFYQEEKP